MAPAGHRPRVVEQQRGVGVSERAERAATWPSRAQAASANAVPTMIASERSASDSFLTGGRSNSSLDLRAGLGGGLRTWRSRRHRDGVAEHAPSRGDESR